MILNISDIQIRHLLAFTCCYANTSDELEIEKAIQVEETKLKELERKYQHCRLIVHHSHLQFDFVIQTMIMLYVNTVYYSMVNKFRESTSIFFLWQVLRKILFKI